MPLTFKSLEMSVTQIPPRDPLAPPQQAEPLDLSDRQHWETAYRGFNPAAVPHLLIQLQDDLSRSRKREAVWLSVVIHLLVVILLVNSDRLMGFFPRRALVLPATLDLNKEKDATYLELPPDEQKLTRRPDSKIISDKDRIATSKTPQINREDLRKLLQSRHPGRPEPQAQQPQSAPPPAVAQNQPPPQENPQPNPNSGLVAPAQNPQTAQLQPPPRGAKPSFTTPSTAGSAIEQAARAAAANRGNYGGGDSGDYGLNQGRNGANAALAPAEILTDTMGVDFGPYIQRILATIRQNWIASLPPSAFAPIWKQGKTSIEFTILKNGQVTGMVWHSGSGDIPLDRAAWGSITRSAPLPPLPREFPGQNLGLRLYFFCNMEVGEMK